MQITIKNHQIQKTIWLVVFLVVGLLSASAQVTITGTVTDAESGETLPGVNVVEKGTLNGTLTNIEGKYTITVSDTATLEVSSLGYVGEIVMIGDQQMVNVLLVPDILALDEIVVVGYGGIKKSDITGAVSSVNTEEMAKMVTSSAATALQGRAAGVQVTQSSGAPGAGINIKIRGTGTINNSSPLYVVDGVIVEDISHIPPENISSFEALKDAGSAAIYGSRGANGVILITTKSGSEGPVKVSFNTSYSVKDFWKVIDVMDANEFMLFNQIANRSASKITDAYNAFNQNLSPEEMYPLVYDGTVQEGQFDGDWFNRISQRGGVQRYNLSVSGGTDKLTYFVSGNIFEEKGLIQTSNFSDKSVLADTKLKINDRSSIRSNINYSYKSSSRVPKNALRQALIFSPIKGLYDEGGNGYLVYSPYTNVIWNHDDLVQDKLTISLQYDLEISPNISFQSKGAYVNNSETNDKFTEAGEVYYFYLNNKTNLIEKNLNERKKLQWDNLITWKKELGNHSLNGVGVFSIENYSFEEVKTKIRGAAGNDPNNAYLSSGFTNKELKGYRVEASDVGLITRVNYAYANKYLVQANFRADGSSRFRNKKWGYFPSASLGWRLTKERFINLPQWVNMWKLRASWGLLGNSRIHEYASYSFLNPGFSYAYGSNLQPTILDGWAAESIANENIEWEKTSSYNIATDLNLFNAFSVSAEYFWKYTNDMLIRVPLVPSSGMEQYPFQNAGKVENQGVELTMEFRKKFGKFGVNVNYNISAITNEVVSLGTRNDPVFGALDGSETFFRTKTQVGHPISEYYGWITDGLNDEGDFKFADLNGDGQITETDRTAIGNPQPKYMSGLNLNFTYQNFDLSIFLQGVFKVDVWNSLLYDLQGYHGTNAFNDSWDQFYFPYKFLSGVPAELDNSSTATLPAPVSADVKRNYRPSDFYIEDASYLRVKNIQLGYKIPAQLTSRVGLESLRLYVSASNLLTFTKYSGLDPEIGGSNNTSNTALGFDNANYPQARTITLGINANF